MSPSKLTEPGLFEKSYREVHRRAKREEKLCIEVIMQIRRASLVAQLKRTQTKGAK